MDRGDDVSEIANRQSFLPTGQFLWAQRFRLTRPPYWCIKSLAEEVPCGRSRVEVGTGYLGPQISSRKVAEFF